MALQQQELVEEVDQVIQLNELEALAEVVQEDKVRHQVMELLEQLTLAVVVAVELDILQVLVLLVEVV